MKINKIYIGAFGGLKDFTLEFDEKFNVVYGENENGKSTVAAFIKAMFYGTGKKVSNLSESIREKYTPWDGGIMGGCIYFEHKGIRYRLEKEFRKSDSTDRSTLKNEDTGETLSVSSSVGEEFFGIGIAAFERSVFIGNSPAFTSDSSAVGDFNLKLSNIALTGDENISYESVNKRLEKARKALLSKTGKAGMLAENRAALAELKSQLTKSLSQAQQRTALSEEAAECKKRADELEEKYKNLRIQLERENDVKNIAKLKDLIDLNSKLDSLNSSLATVNGDTVSEGFVSAINFGIERYRKHKAKAEDLESEIYALNKTISDSSEENILKSKREFDDINSEIHSLEEKKKLISESIEKAENALISEKSQLESVKSSKKAFNPILLIFGIILAAAGLALIFFNRTAAFALIGTGLILSALSFIIKPSNDRLISEKQNQISKSESALSQLRSKRASVLEQISANTSKLAMLSAVLQTDNALRAQRSEELIAKKSLLQTESQRCESSAAEVIAYFSKYKDITDVEKIAILNETLKSQLDEKKKLKLEISYIIRDTGDITANEAARRIKEIGGGKITSCDFSKIKSDAEAVHNQLTDTKTRISAIEAQLKSGFSDFINPETLKRKIAELEETVKSEEAYCAILDTALEVLEESTLEMRKSYSWALEKSAAEIFSELTDSRYKNVSISHSLNMTAEQSGDFREIDLGYLSTGTVDQAYLSMRLAILKLLSEDEPLPVILDDSLSQYDDRRAQAALSFLMSFSESNQTILFTCHDSICNFAQEHKANIIKIN